MNKASVQIDFENISKIQGLLDEYVGTKQIAGASCLILRGGREVSYFESGLRDVEAKLPITRDTIFRMFSMTKPVTSVAVMQLFEQGKIDLGDPVSKYLPGFKKQRCYKDGKITYVSEEMTIKNLLDMTSGLCYPGDSNPTEKITGDFVDDATKKLHTEEEISTVDLMNELGKLPLAFEPGDRWNYSFSADVLGAIVEVVSGVKFSEYLKKNIFEPLEMFDTDFYVPEEKQNRLARAYYADGVELKEYIGENLLIQSRMEERPKFESGGAGLSSTIDDYSKICTMLLNGGEYNGEKILHPGTVRYMTGGGLNEKQRSAIGNWNYLAGYTYGNLLRVLKYPGESYTLGSAGEYGWDGWLGVYMSNIPEYDLTILYMQQKPDCGTTDIVNKLRNIVFTSLGE